MTAFRVFFLLAALLAVCVHVDAQCSQGQTPNVCRYGNNQLNGIAGSNTFNTCAAVNQNPFAVRGIFAGSVTAEQCETFARQDGNKCIEFYAQVQCAGACNECGRGICQSFCDDYADICPTPTENGCFQFINCESSSPCTRWAVDTDELPDPIRTTTSGTTRTTTSNTGTGTGTTTTGGDDDSGAAQLTICAAALIFAVLSIFA